MNAKPMKDERPTMNLGHLAIPNVSASQDWLRRQGEQRQAAARVVIDVAKDWFGHHMPDSFYEGLAEKIVAALDHRI